MLKFISDKIIQCGDYVYTKWSDTTVVKLIKEDGTVKKEYVKIDKTEFYTTLPSCTDIVSIEGLEKLTKLNTLHCSGSKIKSFEDFKLPETLKSLRCNNNQHITLKGIPDSVETLICSNSKLKTLDNLPKSLKYLICYNNEISSITNLPKGLKKLDCSHNKIKYLENLPEGLEELICNNNEIEYLTLSSNLVRLSCSQNKLKRLDNFSSGLEKINCSFNDIGFLGKLPKWLNELDCRNNEITSLENLPSDLKILRCSNNKITLLDLKNCSYIRYLDFSNNKMTSLSGIPLLVTGMIFEGNPLEHINGIDCAKDPLGYINECVIIKHYKSNPQDLNLSPEEKETKEKEIMKNRNVLKSFQILLDPFLEFY